MLWRCRRSGRLSAHLGEAELLLRIRNTTQKNEHTSHRGITPRKSVSQLQLDSRSNARFPVRIPFWALSSGFLRVARHSPARRINCHS
jgi:hypothetical protein